MINGVVLVCFYGPESTGKTTMARELARRFHTGFVPEVAREIITDNTAFTARDIELTGKAQVERTMDKVRSASRILFCDADLITTAIYSQHYLGMVPAGIASMEKMIAYDCYFLFDIDVPWVDDGVRDLGTLHDRQEMYDIFREALEVRQIPHVMVQGSWEERERIVLDTIFRKFRIKP